eukprot:410944-Amphidinium_carterae.1
MLGTHLAVDMPWMLPYTRISHSCRKCSSHQFEAANVRCNTSKFGIAQAHTHNMANYKLAV